jgi:hypothetical protein
MCAAVKMFPVEPPGFASCCGYINPELYRIPEEPKPVPPRMPAVEMVEDLLRITRLSDNHNAIPNGPAEEHEKVR